MLRALILLVTLIMSLPTWSMAADKYVRPLGGSYGAENGTSYAAAFDGFVDISGLAAGDRLYICGTHTAEQLELYVDGTIASLVEISGECPSDPGTLAPTAQNYALYVEGSYLNIHHLTINGAGAALYPVLLATNGGVNTDISGVKFHNNTITNGINANAECLGYYGSDVQIYDNTLSHCAADGIHGHGGLNAQILRNTFTYMSEGAVDDGDCIHITFISGGSLIEGNSCNRTNNDRKYCYIVTSATTAGVARINNNDCVRNSTSTVGSGIYAESGVVVTANRVTGGLHGIQCAEQIALTQCDVIGNLIVRPHDNGVILGTSSTNSVVANNTIISPGLEGIFTANNGSAVRLINNIIYTSYTQCIDKQSGNIEMYNDLYGCSTPVANSDVSTTIGTGTITTDPLFASVTNGDYRLLGTSPARRAGTSGYLCRDYRDRACYPDRPNMGADAGGSGRLAGTRLPRQ